MSAKCHDSRLQSWSLLSSLQFFHRFAWQEHTHFRNWNHHAISVTYYTSTLQGKSIREKCTTICNDTKLRFVQQNRCERCFSHRMIEVILTLYSFSFISFEVLNFFFEFVWSFEMKRNRKKNWQVLGNMIFAQLKCKFTYWPTIKIPFMFDTYINLAPCHVGNTYACVR